jgi:chromosome segregation ATPase
MAQPSAPHSKVMVSVRLRPSLPGERPAGHLVVNETDSTIDTDAASGARHRYDHVLGGGAGQGLVYELTAKRIVREVMNGVNGCLIAYGQTGAGKTYTLTELARGELGIIPRALGDIFAHVERTSAVFAYTVRVTYLQLYMGSVLDLLHPGHAPLEIREVGGAFVVPGLSEHRPRTIEDVLALLEFGGRSKVMAQTTMNRSSSRSHTIMTVVVERTPLRPEALEGPATRSKLTCVDLAGSERVKRSQAQGVQLQEAKSINLSLSALGNVVAALAGDSQQHIPWRDSKLTRLLQDTLGGRSNTSIIINISPAEQDLGETSTSLLFGRRAMEVRANPVVNEFAACYESAKAKEHHSRLEEECAALRNDKAYLLRRLAELEAENEATHAGAARERDELLARLRAAEKERDDALFAKDEVVAAMEALEEEAAGLRRALLLERATRPSANLGATAAVPPPPSTTMRSAAVNTDPMEAVLQVREVVERINASPTKQPPLKKKREDPPAAAVPSSAQLLEALQRVAELEAELAKCRAATASLGPVLGLVDRALGSLEDFEKENAAVVTPPVAAVAAAPAASANSNSTPSLQQVIDERAGLVEALERAQADMDAVLSRLGELDERAAEDRAQADARLARAVADAEALKRDLDAQRALEPELMAKFSRLYDSISLVDADLVACGETLHRIIHSAPSLPPADKDDLSDLVARHIDALRRGLHEKGFLGALAGRGLVEALAALEDVRARVDLDLAAVVGHVKEAVAAAEAAEKEEKKLEEEERVRRQRQEHQRAPRTVSVATSPKKTNNTASTATTPPRPTATSKATSATSTTPLAEPSLLNTSANLNMSSIFETAVANVAQRDQLRRQAAMRAAAVSAAAATSTSTSTSTTTTARQAASSSATQTPGAAVAVATSEFATSPIRPARSCRCAGLLSDCLAVTNEVREMISRAAAGSSGSPATTLRCRQLSSDVDATFKSLRDALSRHTADGVSTCDEVKSAFSASITGLIEYVQAALVALPSQEPPPPAAAAPPAARSPARVVPRAPQTVDAASSPRPQAPPRLSFTSSTSTSTSSSTSFSLRPAPAPAPVPPSSSTVELQAFLDELLSEFRRRAREGGDRVAQQSSREVVRELERFLRERHRDLVGPESAAALESFTSALDADLEAMGEPSEARRELIEDLTTRVRGPSINDEIAPELDATIDRLVGDLDATLERPGAESFAASVNTILRNAVRVVGESREDSRHGNRSAVDEAHHRSVLLEHLRLRVLQTEAAGGGPRSDTPMSVASFHSAQSFQPHILQAAASAAASGLGTVDEDERAARVAAIVQAISNLENELADGAHSAAPSASGEPANLVPYVSLVTTTGNPVGLEQRFANLLSRAGNLGASGGGTTFASILEYVRLSTATVIEDAVAVLEEHDIGKGGVNDRLAAIELQGDLRRELEGLAGHIHSAMDSQQRLVEDMGEGEPELLAFAEELIQEFGKLVADRVSVLVSRSSVVVASPSTRTLPDLGDGTITELVGAENPVPVEPHPAPPPAPGPTSIRNAINSGLRRVLADMRASSNNNTSGNILNNNHNNSRSAFEGSVSPIPTMSSPAHPRPPFGAALRDRSHLEAQLEFERAENARLMRELQPLRVAARSAVSPLAVEEREDAAFTELCRVHEAAILRLSTLEARCANLYAERDQLVAERQAREAAHASVTSALEAQARAALEGRDGCERAASAEIQRLNAAGRALELRLAATVSELDMLRAEAVHLRGVEQTLRAKAAERDRLVMEREATLNGSVRAMTNFEELEAQFYAVVAERDHLARALQAAAEDAAGAARFVDELRAHNEASLHARNALSAENADLRRSVHHFEAELLFSHQQLAAERSRLEVVLLARQAEASQVVQGRGVVQANSFVAATMEDKVQQTDPPPQLHDMPLSPIRRGRSASEDGLLAEIATSPVMTHTRYDSQGTSPQPLAQRLFADRSTGTAVHVGDHATSPMGRPSSFASHATSPMGRPSTLATHATSPMGRPSTLATQATSPMGRPSTLATHATSPMGRPSTLATHATSPIGRPSTLATHATSPIGRPSSFTSHATSPHALPVLSATHATSPIGRQSAAHATSPLSPHRRPLLSTHGTAMSPRHPASSASTSTTPLGALMDAAAATFSRNNASTGSAMSPRPSSPLRERRGLAFATTIATSPTRDQPQHAQAGTQSSPVMAEALNIQRDLEEQLMRLRLPRTPAPSRTRQLEDDEHDDHQQHLALVHRVGALEAELAEEQRRCADLRSDVALLRRREGDLDREAAEQRHRGASVAEEARRLAEALERERQDGERARDRVFSAVMLAVRGAAGSLGIDLPLSPPSASSSSLSSLELAHSSALEALVRSVASLRARLEGDRESLAAEVAALSARLAVREDEVARLGRVQATLGGVEAQIADLRAHQASAAELAARRISALEGDLRDRARELSSASMKAQALEQALHAKSAQLSASEAARETALRVGDEHRAALHAQMQAHSELALALDRARADLETQARRLEDLGSRLSAAQAAEARLREDLASERAAADSRAREMEAELQRCREERASSRAEMIRAKEEARVAQDEKRDAEDQRRIAEDQKRATEGEKRAAEDEKRAAVEAARFAEDARGRAELSELAARDAQAELERALHSLQRELQGERAASEAAIRSARLDAQASLEAAHKRSIDDLSSELSRARSAIEAVRTQAALDQRRAVEDLDARHRAALRASEAEASRRSAQAARALAAAEDAASDQAREAQRRRDLDAARIADLEAQLRKLHQALADNMERKEFESPVSSPPRPAPQQQHHHHQQQQQHQSQLHQQLREAHARADELDRAYSAMRDRLAEAETQQAQAQRRFAAELAKAQRALAEQQALHQHSASEASSSAATLTSSLELFAGVLNDLSVSAGADITVPPRPSLSQIGRIAEALARSLVDLRAAASERGAREPPAAPTIDHNSPTWEALYHDAESKAGELASSAARLEGEVRTLTRRIQGLENDRDIARAEQQRAEAALRQAHQHQHHQQHQTPQRQRDADVGSSAALARVQSELSRARSECGALRGEVEALSAEVASSEALRRLDKERIAFLEQALTARATEPTPDPGEMTRALEAECAALIAELATHRARTEEAERRLQEYQLLQAEQSRAQSRPPLQQQQQQQVNPGHQAATAMLMRELESARVALRLREEQVAMLSAAKRPAATPSTPGRLPELCRELEERLVASERRLTAAEGKVASAEALAESERSKASAESRRCQDLERAVASLEASLDEAEAGRVTLQIRVLELERAAATAKTASLPAAEVDAAVEAEKRRHDRQVHEDRAQLRSLKAENALLAQRLKGETERVASLAAELDQARADASDASLARLKSSVDAEQSQLNTIRAIAAQIGRHPAPVLPSAASAPAPTPAPQQPPQQQQRAAASYAAQEMEVVALSQRVSSLLSAIDLLNHTLRDSQRAAREFAQAASNAAADRDAALARVAEAETWGREAEKRIRAEVDDRGQLEQRAREAELRAEDLAERLSRLEVRHLSELDEVRSRVAAGAEDRARLEAQQRSHAEQLAEEVRSVQHVADAARAELAKTEQTLRSSEQRGQDLEDVLERVTREASLSAAAAAQVEAELRARVTELEATLRVVSDEGRVLMQDASSLAREAADGEAAVAAARADLQRVARELATESAARQRHLDEAAAERAARALLSQELLDARAALEAIDAESAGLRGAAEDLALHLARTSGFPRRPGVGPAAELSLIGDFVTRLAAAQAHARSAREGEAVAALRAELGEASREIINLQQELTRAAAEAQAAREQALAPASELASARLQLSNAHVELEDLRASAREHRAASQELSAWRGAVPASVRRLLRAATAAADAEAEVEVEPFEGGPGEVAEALDRAVAVVEALSRASTAHSEARDLMRVQLEAAEERWAGALRESEERALRESISAEQLEAQLAASEGTIAHLNGHLHSLLPQLEAMEALRRETLAARADAEEARGELAEAREGMERVFEAAARIGQVAAQAAHARVLEVDTPCLLALEAAGAGLFDALLTVFLTLLTRLAHAESLAVAIAEDTEVAALDCRATALELSLAEVTHVAERGELLDASSSSSSSRARRAQARPLSAGAASLSEEALSAVAHTLTETLARMTPLTELCSPATAWEGVLSTALAKSGRGSMPALALAPAAHPPRVIASLTARLDRLDAVLATEAATLHTIELLRGLIAGIEQSRASLKQHVRDIASRHGESSPAEALADDRPPATSARPPSARGRGQAAQTVEALNRDLSVFLARAHSQAATTATTTTAASSSSVMDTSSANLNNVSIWSQIIQNSPFKR